MSSKTSEFPLQKLTRTAVESDKPTFTDAEVVQMVTLAREWIDVKWRHQGRSMSGVDCVGIFQQIGQQLGRNFQIPNNYTRNPDQKVLVAHMEQFFDRIPKDDRKPGDLALMRFVDERLRMPNRHVVLLTDLGILHAAANFRKVTEHTLDDEWLNRIEYVYRLRRKAG